MRRKLLVYILMFFITAIGLAGGIIWANSMTKSEEKVFDIRARQFAYDPSIIKVKKGSTVTIKFESKDVDHGLYIDGYNINLEASHDKSAEITFVANKAGKFKFRCSIACGAMHPFMVGQLIVEPNYLLPGSIGLSFGLAISSLIFLTKRK
ncbi:MAG: cupredoxin domain-containing protein [Actinobacteria bacterium]|nr:cupredoxin domain-containing protein [Actinomycetota bacterium]